MEDDKIKFSTISKSATIRPNVKIEHPIHVGPKVEIHGGEIGLYTFLNIGTVIYDNVSIGRFVSFGRNCIVGLAEHPTHYLSTSFFRISKNWFPDDPLSQSSNFIKNTRSPEHKRGIKINIGNDVWIGSNVLILRGITIGDGAIIGAGSVVTKDIPPYAIAAGVPAVVKKMRFDDKTIDKLLETKWWDRDINIILKLPLDKVDECLTLLSTDIEL